MPNDIIFPSGGGTIGPITNIPWTTTNYTADVGLIWDVAESEQQDYWYSLLSHELALVNFSVNGSVIDGTSGAGLELRLILPNGWIVKTHSAASFLAVNLGQFKPGIGTLDPGENYIGLGMAIANDAWLTGVGAHTNNIEGQFIVNFE